MGFARAFAGVSLTDESALQLLNAYFGTSLMFFPKATCLTEVQPSNVLETSSVTFVLERSMTLGYARMSATEPPTATSDLHPENSQKESVSTSGPNVTAVIEVQPKNWEFPTNSFTPALAKSMIPGLAAAFSSVSLMVVKDEHPWDDTAPIVSILVPRAIVLMFFAPLKAPAPSPPVNWDISMVSMLRPLRCTIEGALDVLPSSNESWLPMILSTVAAAMTSSEYRLLSVLWRFAQLNGFSPTSTVSTPSESGAMPPSLAASAGSIARMPALSDSIDAPASTSIGSVRATGSPPSISSSNLLSSSTPASGAGGTYSTPSTVCDSALMLYVPSSTAENS